jgi:phosphatidylglycerophosphatase A
MKAGLRLARRILRDTFRIRDSPINTPAFCIRTMKRLALLLATFGYVGYFPIAPGTAGSAAAVPLYLLLRWLAIPGLDVGLIVILCVAGFWAGTVAGQHYGREDPGYVVLDEVVGMLLTLLFIPLTWAGILAGFLLFRLFDIVKPPPARQLERLHGGAGIMMDDVMAGIYGNLALRLLVWLVPAIR